MSPVALILSRMRLRLNAASAAVSGVPSLKVTPGRMANFHVFGSSCDQDVAIARHLAQGRRDVVAVHLARDLADR